MSFGENIVYPGVVCKGWFSNGNAQGSVAVYRDSVKIYEGGWDKSYLRQGLGVEYYENGDRLECMWDKGYKKLDQEMTYYYADGRVYKGKRYGGLENGKGTMTWADGSKFAGIFKNGKPIVN